MISVADLRDPDDPEGRSYREVNRARQHAIPIGSLVEVEGSGGVRLFVVHHARDCDETPLYVLSWGLDVPVFADDRRFYSGKVWHGIAEKYLTVIKDPES